MYIYIIYIYIHFLSMYITLLLFLLSVYIHICICIYGESHKLLSICGDRPGRGRRQEEEKGAKGASARAGLECRSTQYLTSLVLKNHTLNGIWDENPQILGTWTLRGGGCFRISTVFDWNCRELVNNIRSACISIRTCACRCSYAHVYMHAFASHCAGHVQVVQHVFPRELACEVPGRLRLCIVSSKAFCTVVCRICGEHIENMLFLHR